MTFFSAWWLWCGLVAGSMGLIMLAARIGQRRAHRADTRMADQPITLLVIRLEQSTPIHAWSDEQVLERLVAQIMGRMMRELSADDRLQTAYPGYLIATLGGPDAARRGAVAQKLHDLCTIPAVIAGRTIRPEIATASASGTHADHDRLIRELKARLDIKPQAATGRQPAALPRPRVVPLPQADHIMPVKPEMSFQPQIDCSTGQVVALHVAPPPEKDGATDCANGEPPQNEARNGKSGIIPTLRQALAALQHRGQSINTIPAFSIGVSADDLARSDLSESILWELDCQAIAPERLVLGLVAGDPALTPPVIGGLKRLTGAGCRLDIEDAGNTPKSDIDTLRGLPFYRLRIGPVIVSDCDRDPARQQMILAALARAEELRLPVLASGVCTRAEHDFLVRSGCRQLQGPAIVAALPGDNRAASGTAPPNHLTNLDFPDRKIV